MNIFRNKKMLIVCSAVAIVGTIFHFMYSPAEFLQKQDAKPVAVSIVTRENLASNITLSAEFRPFEEADLHAKVAGYLNNITVDIGDQVKAGQVIATLDTDELKADFNRAEADYHDAKLDYDRVSEVIKKHPGLLAQEEVDKAQATYEMAKANMERAKTFLDYATIIVPFDAIVTKRYVDPGAMIQASGNSSTQTLPIVHIAENTKLRLDFPVPESSVSRVKVGTPVKVMVQATGQTINSTVARISGKIDSNTRTMETEVDVDNTDLRITPGMYASVNIDLEQKDGALALPVQAVSVGQDSKTGPNVWRVNDMSEIEEIPVTLGLQTADKIEILSGVKEGDRVVFGSRGNLNLGMKVEPKTMDKKI